MTQTIPLIATDSERCPRCDSSNLIQQTGEDEPTCHYGRLKCKDCGRFITWLRDPTATLSHMNRKSTIDVWFANPEKYPRNEWECRFLYDIYDRRVLTQKQQRHYERIYKKLSSVDAVGTEDVECADCGE
ncbi:MAG: hypothetical protein HC836_31170 [Richelia sp. RM2_1_2]|nr:hypothetical protein [Richelia sp. RM2_1_2]